jgi:FkbM family methyltransferase
MGKQYYLWVYYHQKIDMGLRTLLGLKKNKQTYLNESYSQEGEDSILSRFFEGRQSGFYLDVGALHPQRFSNTYKFYKMGWRGISIDAMPGSMALFKQVRPLDINLEIPVSDTKEKLPFYIFNEHALNTFSKEHAEERELKDEYKIVQTVVIETKKLSDILDEHLPKGQNIDFMSVDAEGFDYKILSSNNWAKYRPTVVLVENELPLFEFMESDIYKLMTAQQYEFMAKTIYTYFFKAK